MSETDKQQCPDFKTILQSGEKVNNLHDLIVECFLSDMQKVAQKLCRNQTLAEDAVQDAVLSTITNLNSFRGEAPLKVWLSRLVRTACSRMRRGRKNSAEFNQPLEAPGIINKIDSVTPNQELQLLISERIDILYDVLKKEKEPNRSLLLLHEGQGLTIAELSEQFDLTTESVKSRLKRTRAKVRKKLESHQ